MTPSRVAAAATALFAIHLASTVAAGVGSWDEAFALRVVQRVMEGDVLYRDVFFGATPFGVHLGRAAAAVFGVEIGAIKVVVAACLTASALLAAYAAHRLTGSWTASAFPVVAQLALAPCDPRGLYNPSADAFLLGAAALAVDRRFAAAGVVAGLCFAAKQNTGLYAVAALLASQWLRDPAAWSPRRAALVVAAFAASAGVVIAPVVAQGALPALVDFGFTGKRHYLAHGGHSVVDGMAVWWRAFADRDLVIAVQGQVHLLPVATAAIVFAAARRLPRAALAFAPFAIAALAVSYPRADVRHLGSAVPALAVLAVAAWRALPDTRPRRAAGRVAFTWIAASAAAIAVALALPVLRGERSWMREPHLRGALVDAKRATALAGTVAQLGPLAGQEVFFATPRASLLYLLSGARNPTPFDWPGLTSMGGDGERRTIVRVRAGGIEAACIEANAWKLAPVALEQAIAEAMPLQRDLGACRLHRRH